VTDTHTQDAPLLSGVMKIEAIARTVHEANRSYCLLIGDNSQPSWTDAPEWQKKSARLGVRGILDGTIQSAEQSHESWLAEKTREGWQYGPTKDPEAKRHPCFVPYGELPESQRKKDEIFRELVLTLAPIYGITIPDLPADDLGSALKPHADGSYPPGPKV
jgi:hypothetical protein